MQIKKATYKFLRKWLIISSSSWARTKDPLINSQKIYLLIFIDIY
jgi:hypothetical protein